MSKQKKMSREEAVELYNDLQKSMDAIMQGKAPAKVVKPQSSYFKNAAQMVNKNAAGAVKSIEGEGGVTSSISGSRVRDRGVISAVTFLLFCGMVKFGVAVIDYTGLMAPTVANAAMINNAAAIPNQVRSITATPQNGLSPEDIKILTSLDSRRVDLEDRSKRLDTREEDIAKRDKEYVDKSGKKDSAQLDQLANVYGSMAPQEAAKLIEQLDVTIALPLLQRMPEKRMGLILPMMSAERALVITRLLSGQKG